MVKQRKNARKPCSIDGCEKPSVGRGWCRTHYSRWQRTGDVRADEPIAVPGPPECQVGDCGEPTEGRGLCRKHYARWRRHGDPTVVLPPGGVREPLSCSVEGCDKSHVAQGYCGRHYKRWKQWGDPLYVYRPPSGADSANWSGDDASYLAAHKRIHRAKGKASRQLCVDCGNQAAEWSYIGGDPDERIGDGGNGKQLPYSLDARYYAPRCHSCHVLFDKRREG